MADAAIAQGVDWRWGHRLVAAERDAATACLLLSASRGDSSRERISASFAIDASGRSATLARRFGAKRRTATERIARESERAAPFRRPGRGWIAIAARSNGWDYAAEGPGGRAHSLFFGHALLGRPTGARAWEAGFSILDRCSGADWVAAGDAAAAFDPLTSQGLPQALASGVAAAHAVRCLLAGDGSAADAYGTAVLRTWCHSLTGAHEVYASERRWPDSPFWQAACAPNTPGTRR